MSESQKYIDAIKNGELTIFQKMALCVNEKRTGDIIEIECSLGLWSVSGTKYEFIYNEALHYFKQYMDDGEYSSIIGGKSVAEKLFN